MAVSDGLALLGDWWAGRRDGAAGVPAPRWAALSTPHRDRLIDWAHERYEQERLAHQAILAEEQRGVAAGMARLWQAEETLELAQARVAELADGPAEPVLAQRRLGEDRRSDETVRARRIREHATRFVAAEAQARVARAGVEDAEKALAAYREGLQRHAEQSDARVRRIHAHCHRRLAVYRKSLVRRHRWGGLVAQGMDVFEPGLPGWLEQHPPMPPIADPGSSGLAVSGLSCHVLTGDRLEPMLSRVSFTQQPRTVLAIRGESTALFAALLGLLPTSGGMHFDGLNLRTHREIAGLIPKQPAFPEDRTARRALQHADGSRLRLKRRLRERVVTVCQLLDLEPLLDKKIRDLSKGQRKRLAVATEILIGKRLLILNEPVEGPDRLAVLAGLRRVAAAGCTVLFTASSALDLEYADKVVLFGTRGTVVFAGDPAALPETSEENAKRSQGTKSVRTMPDHPGPFR